MLLKSATSTSSKTAANSSKHAHRHYRARHPSSSPDAAMSPILARLACALYLAGMLCTTGVSAGVVLRRDANLPLDAARGVPSVLKMRQDSSNSASADALADASGDTAPASSLGATGKASGAANPDTPVSPTVAGTDSCTFNDVDGTYERWDITLTGVSAEEYCGYNLQEKLIKSLARNFKILAPPITRYRADCDAASNTTMAHFEYPSRNSDPGAVDSAVYEATEGRVQCTQSP